MGAIEITTEENKKNTTHILDYISKTSSGDIEWQTLSSEVNKMPLEFDMTLVENNLQLPEADENIQTFVRSCLKGNQINQSSEHYEYSWRTDETPRMKLPET